MGSEGDTEGDLSMAMLWLSHPSVTAHPHFDKSHNFLTQVIGSKKVLLWSPEQTPFLYPHQERDPYKKQTKVDMSAPDLVKFPKFIMASAIEVILEPGDSLYIPPFWWHRITSLTTSLSLSVVSPSKIEAILAAANYISLPFLQRNATKYPSYLKHVRMTDVEPEIRVVAVQVFIGHLLSRLSSSFSSLSSKKFSNHHIKNRMKPSNLATLVRETLYEPHLTSSGSTLSDLLFSEQDNHLLDLCDAGSGVGGKAEQMVSAHKEALEKLPKVAIIKAAQQVVDTLLDLSAYEGGTGILEWWLIEYLDDLARWSLGAHGALDTVVLLDEFVDRCFGSITTLPEIKPQETKWVEGNVLKIEDIDDEGEEILL
mmetsp:Transcript_18140/g.23581  ORF Transcript_18140/g.23581 Transcript_18140/m.23581 type:complete len:369 (-) Transcript_18140:128-1234(-)